MLLGWVDGFHRVLLHTKDLKWLKTNWGVSKVNQIDLLGHNKMVLRNTENQPY